MSNATVKHRGIISGAGTLLMLFGSWASAPCHAQDGSPVAESVTVDAVIKHADDFFTTWKSVAMQVQSERYFMSSARTNSTWIPLGYELSELAWDADRWRESTRSVNTAYSAPGKTYNAESTEFVAQSEVVVQAEYRALDLPGKCFNFDWLEEFDFRRQEQIVFAYTGNDVVNATRVYRPALYFLTGVNPAVVTDDANILTRFRRSANVRLSRTRDQNRDCWQITMPSDDGRGSVTLCLCPELQWGPVRIQQELGPGDLFGSGDRVRDSKTIDDEFYQSWSRSIRLESISKDWSEFSIRDEMISVDVRGAKFGFSSVKRIKAIQRPAPDSAFLLQTRIPNGTPVVLMKSQQIKAEWRDGKVVRVYDGEAVKELATVRMAPAGPNWVRWSVLAVLTAGGGVVAWKRWGRTALAKSKPELPRRR